MVAKIILQPSQYCQTPFCRVYSTRMDPITSEIYGLVKKKVAEQGAFDRDAYDQIVEETIYYFKEKGKLTDEDNEEFIKDELSEMYEILRDELAEE